MPDTSQSPKKVVWNINPVELYNPHHAQLQLSHTMEPHAATCTRLYVCDVCDVLFISVRHLQQFGDVLCLTV